MRYADKVVLITGAGRGIGRATALRLAGEGASLAILDRDAAAAEEAAGAVREAGRAALALAADITDQAALAGVQQRFGRIDVLVNSRSSRRRLKR